MKYDQSKESKTWQSLIQPIIDEYGIKDIKYRYIPSEYNDIEILKIERLTNDLCNQRPFSNFRELMLKWRNGIISDTFPYKKYFIEFMNHLFDEKILPHFLEFLYKDNEDSIRDSLGNQLLPCKPGTKWEEIKITLIEDDAVRIETPQGKERCSYHELGMSDKRKGNKPTMIWALLKLFAKNQGYLTRTSGEYNPTLPDTAKRLNKRLQEIFNIHDSIFTDRYKTERGYRTKIFFSDQTQVT
jgi:hypothetical protein